MTSQNIITIDEVWIHLQPALWSHQLEITLDGNIMNLVVFEVLQMQILCVLGCCS